MRLHAPPAVLIGLSVIFLGGCAHLSAEPVRAQVVDESGQPVPGVVVVAYWELHKGSFTGDALPCGAADVEESVTGQDGRFEIPSWGPVWSSCDMPGYNPWLTLFKSGYYPVGLNNDSADSLETVSVSRSIWNGKTITLRKYPSVDLTKVQSPSYRSEFSGMNQTLENFIVNFPSECNWKKIPNMLRAIYSQERQFEAVGHGLDTIPGMLITNDKFMVKVAPKCGSPKAFIEGLVK
ncbi:MAG TPA: hypothetical protein VGH91_11645 [Gammaproteobacteria bacterium]|jgi:hypothetical protein